MISLHICTFTLSLYQSKEKEIISDLRKSNLPLAFYLEPGTAAAHTLCTSLCWIKWQHRGLRGVTQRNKTEANTHSSVSVQAIEKRDISFSSTLTPGSNCCFPSPVPLQCCFTPIHLTHTSGYTPEKTKTNNSRRGPQLSQSLGFVKLLCTWRQERHT